MASEAPLVIDSLVTAFSTIPYGGMKIQYAEDFGNLYLKKEALQKKEDQLEDVFSSPIDIDLDLLPIASKLQIRGNLKTRAENICDRCTDPMTVPIEEPFDLILMPSAQFSKHDKPEGKVIHGRTKDRKPSQHHSASKVDEKELTDGFGEHEDIAFGAFDGERVDLRPLIREQLILALPMTWVCSADCQGICPSCLKSLNSGPCSCDPAVFDEAQVGSLGRALQKKTSVSGS